MKAKKVIALVIAAAFAAPLAAQSGSGTVQPRDSNPSGSGATASGGFAAIDRNNDGYLSRDEARDATWSNRFTELDKDNDERLSRSEFDALGAGAAGASGTQSGSSTSGIGDKPGQKQ